MSKRQSFRKKRSDTKMGTIEKKYGKDFGVRSDKKLGNYLKDKGYGSLSELLNSKDGKPKR
tara:strand:- start:16393 stop:16575 length:183 start_codon:yes stop_codon:yes gene_type:complete